MLVAGGENIHDGVQPSDLLLRVFSLGFDSFLAGMAIGPIIRSGPGRAWCIALFGVCDGLATLFGAFVPHRLPDPPAAALYLLGVMLIIQSARHSRASMSQCRFSSVSTISPPAAPSQTRRCWRSQRRDGRERPRPWHARRRMTVNLSAGRASADGRGTDRLGSLLRPNGNRITVPAPSTTPGAPWLLDFLAGEARRLREVGFSAIQLPPVSKAQGGAGSGCDGYGVFDVRDIGSKPQQGSTPTRYGSADSLRRMVACSHAVGLDVYLDVVMHQLIGENGGPGIFRYLGADGKALNGRGAMHPGCFRGRPTRPPFRREDAVPVPADDFPFGREKVYQNCDPPGYTTEDALDYGDWLFRTTDADGMRFDDTKGTWAPFVSRFMRSRAMACKFAYAEYFDGNPASLDWWATSAPMSSRSLVEDFTLHWALQAACNGNNARALDGAGYIARNPFLACTFVDNPDTDTSPGEQVISNKLLAYAFLLSAEGYPFVYGKDYFGGDVWPGAYGLKPWIDNLIWIHETLAAGSTVTRYLDDNVIVLNRMGAPGLLTALNFDTWNRRTITCQTGFGGNVDLHDYTGRHPDIRTNADGRRRSRSHPMPTNPGRAISASPEQALERRWRWCGVRQRRHSSVPMISISTRCGTVRRISAASTATRTRRCGSRYSRALAGRPARRSGWRSPDPTAPSSASKLSSTARPYRRSRYARILPAGAACGRPPRGLPAWYRSRRPSHTKLPSNSPRVRSCHNK